DVAQATGVVPVVQRRALLIARALEVAGDGVALPERLRVRDRPRRDRGDEPDAGDDESENERHEAPQSHPGALSRRKTLLPTLHAKLRTLARPLCNGLDSR